MLNNCSRFLPTTRYTERHSGKLDPGETPTAACAREAWEETGVIVDPDHLRLAHTVHHHQGDGAPDRIGFFFEATAWEHEPVNREADKCLRLAWFAVHDLPDDLIPYPEAGLRAYLDGDPGITVHGRPDDTERVRRTESPTRE
ncbi:NUDIX domain-containing protein [Embleya sp. NBC_00888]|uniref:NUDIX domain-containing protein n=1 Tax=Embleya sp. NBC_00888 TaxID=2975960 RepID=UPI00386FFA71|nr:NUDIX domain-containing protein [Embleya sp. NBC_00888]